MEAPLNSAYIVELAPEGRTARYGGILSAYVQAYIVSASLVCFLTTSVVAPDAMASWGWRILFVVGAVGGLVFLGCAAPCRRPCTPRARRPRTPRARSRPSYPCGPGLGRGLAAPAGAPGDRLRGG
ncbi:hypothetical protein ACFQV4_28925 [Streptomyces thermocarboxydus]